ncbi:MAG: glycosyltransferase family 2 protein [Aquificae bacterium]|nr:glycosyltransferase family 2 protein [Aquificota bacterium]
MVDKKVYIVILNYNGWKDTIECLESVLRIDYPNYQVIVVDNNSSDNSFEYIKQWANGELDIWINKDHPLKNLSFPPVKKPLSLECIDGEKFEKTLCPLKQMPDNGNVPPTTKEPLVLIQSKKNLGYAGGNNLGIKYALSKNDFEYIWILNNDTVVEKNALKNLVACSQEKGDKYFPLGSLLLYYDKPDTIQAAGGSFSSFIGAGSHIFANQKLSPDVKKALTKVNIDYPVGASLFLSKEFIKNVGLLDEDYFIYFEEIDISFRGKEKGYKPALCLESIVYHKESATIDNVNNKVSTFSDFYAMRNRLLFAKKRNRQKLAFAYISLLIAFFNRIRRKEFEKAKNILKILIQGERCSMRDFGS